MPKFLERRLKAEAAKKGFTGRRAAHYVYGTMNAVGAMKGNKETAKGREMEKKHEKDKHMAKAAFHMTRITHHDDGSHTVEHEPHRKVVKGGAFTEQADGPSYSAGNDKELFAKLQKHIGAKQAQDEAKMDKEPEAEVEHEEETVA